MPENSSSVPGAGKKSLREYLLSSADLPWKVGFILLLVLAGWLYVSRAFDVYATSPLPAGDAAEYFELARRFFYDNPPSDNIWLSRWPTLPLLLCLIWHLTGVSALVQYLFGGAALLATAAVVCTLARKYWGWPFALVCLVLLLFQPVIINNVTRGLTEPVFALLVVLLLASGYLLSERPLLYLLSTAVTASLLVLCKEEGRYFAAFALILFSIYYIKNRQFSWKLFIALFSCTAAAAFSLYAYQQYVENHKLIPMSYRIGSYYFYKEFLEGRVAFNDDNRFYTLMNFFNFLKIYPPGELAGILLRGISNIRRVFDCMLFPGASLLVTVGLIRSFFSRWGLMAFYTLPLVGFYLLSFAFHTDSRFLLPFYCLSLPLALHGLKQIAFALPFIQNPDFRHRLVGAVPVVFCFMALFFGHLLSPEKTENRIEYTEFPDQTRLQERIITLISQGKFEQAADSLELGLYRNPNWAFFHLALGVTRYADGAKDSAFEYIEKSIYLNPYQADAYYIAYYLLSREDQRDKALTCLERSLEYRPEFPPINRLLQQIYTATGRTDKLSSLNRKSLFNYYLQHDELRAKAQINIKAWNKLLHRHFPLPGAKLINT